MHEEATTIIVALSGPICVGKTTLASGLVEQLSAAAVTTRDVLIRELGPRADRRSLQRLGRQLDDASQGRWVADAAKTLVSQSDLVVVDAVRTVAQIDHLAVRGSVFHFHLTAPANTLERRYEEAQRLRPDVEHLPYASVAADETEAQVHSLAMRAGVVIDTSIHSIEETRAVAVLAVREAN